MFKLNTCMLYNRGRKLPSLTSYFRFFLGDDSSHHRPSIIPSYLLEWMTLFLLPKNVAGRKGGSAWSYKELVEGLGKNYGRRYENVTIKQPRGGYRPRRMARDDYRHGKKVMHDDAKATIVVKLEQSLLRRAAKKVSLYYVS